MLKKIRRRFILAAMAAFGAVMLIIVSGINGANYIQTTSMQDHLAMDLFLYGPRVFKQPGGNTPPFRSLHSRSPEAEFITRFFTVKLNTAGDIQSISRDHISSIDNETAAEYTRAILGKGKEKGYYRDYRYLVQQEPDGTTVLFLNASTHLHFMRSLLLVSFSIGAISLVLVFFLVMFFSKYAIRPYARNIERQKQFITDAGHELKTPITSIATSADIAAMEHEGDEWIANIQKQTARLARLTGDLVALSRLDEEMPFPEMCRFSLSEAVWEAAEPFAVLAKAQGKHYFQNIEEHIDYKGDRDSIQKIVSILLDNGVRYSDEEGEIRLDVYRRHGKVYMEVFNTCHLPDNFDPDRLFDRFYRLDESRSVHLGGTGIGLSMALAIAENHGGKITVKCFSGKTICFKVIL